MECRKNAHGVGTISGLVIALVYTVLITVGVFQLRKAYVTRNQSLAILDVNQQSQEALTAIISDLRKSMVFLGACPLNRIIVTNSLEKKERGNELILLTTENNRISIVASESRNLGNNLLIWSGKDFIAGDEVTICNGSTVQSGKILNVGLSATNINLTQLRFTQDWTTLDWQLPVIVAKTKSIRYWVGERGGNSVLFRKENQGNDVTLARGIYELLFEYQDKNGIMLSGLDNNSTIVGFRVSVKSLPLQPELLKFLDDEDRQGINLAYNMPYLNILPLPHPLKLLTQAGTDNDGVDSVTLQSTK